MSKKEYVWLKYAREIFESTPAYSKFLKSMGVHNLKGFPPSFTHLPLTNKKNYIEKYPLIERLAKGRTISDYYMICTSSGSAGDPTTWPRDYELDKKAIEFNYQMYKDLFDTENKKTLVVVTFGLGAWTAGMLTSRLCWEMPRSAKVSVVTPGLDKIIAFKAINSLSKYFDQTIITGYPPFIIDLINYGQSKKFDFKKINTKIHFTSAGLLEHQREKLAAAVSKNKKKNNVLGFYASSEAGIIGIETPETLEIVDSAYNNTKFCEALFGSPNPPTFVTYNPNVRFLEACEGRIVLTVQQPVALIRYDTKDRGGIFDGDYLKRVCKAFDVKFPMKLIDKSFVYVFGRADAVRLLCNIYVDDILYCISKSEIKDKLTGNFKYGLVDKGLKNVLKVKIFYKNGISLSSKEKSKFVKKFDASLKDVNPDYKMVSTGIKFEFNIVFVSEREIKYKGGKFDYSL